MQGKARSSGKGDSRSFLRDPRQVRHTAHCSQGNDVQARPRDKEFGKGLAIRPHCLLALAAAGQLLAFAQQHDATGFTRRATASMTMQRLAVRESSEVLALENLLRQSLSFPFEHRAVDVRVV